MPVFNKINYNINLLGLIFERNLKGYISEVKIASGIQSTINVNDKPLSFNDWKKHIINERKKNM